MDITRKDRDVFKVLLTNHHLVSMKNSGAKSCLNAQVWKKHDHVRLLSKKTILCIDAKATSSYLSSSTATLESYWMEPPTHNIAHLRLAISVRSIVFITVLIHAWFTVQDKFYIKDILLTITFEVRDGDSTTHHLFAKYCQSPLLILDKHRTTNACRNMHRWRVKKTSSTTKCIADVHSLVPITQTTAVSWHPTILIICSARVPDLDVKIVRHEYCVDIFTRRRYNSDSLDTTVIVL